MTEEGDVVFPDSGPTPKTYTLRSQEKEQAEEREHLATLQDCMRDNIFTTNQPLFHDAHIKI